jgi:hypothetical protein
MDKLFLLSRAQMGRIRHCVGRRDRVSHRLPVFTGEHRNGNER